MKTIVRDGNYQRVQDADADMRVKTGWKFCPKSEWKTNVRDFERASREEIEAAKAEKKSKAKEKKS